MPGARRSAGPRPPARTVALVVLALGAIAGCGPGDRVDRHLARADELLAEGRSREAIVELRSAAQLRPDDRALSLRIAEVAAATGQLDEAAEYYADAYALDPSDDATALALARLLIHDDPERSAALVDEVLARDPDHARALLVRAEAELAAGRVPEARQLVERAQRLAPDDPEIELVVASVFEARVRAIRARSGAGVKDRRSLDPILAAYDRYLAKGGTQRVLAALGRARAIGSWSGLEAEAAEAYREAIRVALESGTPYEKVQVLSASASYASGIGDAELERAALEHWVALAPDAVMVWEQLASVPGPAGEDLRDATFERMLAANPEHAGAHVVHARHLGETRGYGTAVAYLEQRLGQGLDDAALLTGIVNLQHAHRRPGDAANTLARMQREYADRPATALLVARHQLSEQRADDAVATLRAAIEEHETVEAWRLLARAELDRQRLDDARAAVEKAIALSGSRVPENLRLKARVHLAYGEARKSANTLSQLARIEPLTVEDKLMMARAYYRSGGAIHGRALLEGLLTGRRPNAEAALELAHWEMENPNRRPVVRRYLEAAYQRDPANLELIEALTRDDLENDAGLVALSRVTRAILQHPVEAPLYLVRARIMHALGLPDDAVLDARRAVGVSSQAADEASELIALVYLRAPDQSIPIRALEQRDARGEANADELALLARLLLESGDVARARALYERALAGGSELALLKNDLAYLLAASGDDLPRALELAREAANAPGESLAAADTLGFVYLQSGQYEAAFWQFRFVTAEANPPVADYFYHLGLALQKLERTAEARDALAEVLRLEPGHAGAGAALRELEAAAAAAPPPSQPS